MIRAGKCLPVTATEVFVKLRQPPLTKLPPGSNYFRFRLGPDLSLSLGARVKKTRPASCTTMETELSAVTASGANEMAAYERLLTDAMKGDSLLFVRQNAVEAAWSIVDPILGEMFAHPYLSAWNLGTARSRRTRHESRRLAQSGGRACKNNEFQRLAAVPSHQHRRFFTASGHVPRGLRFSPTKNKNSRRQQHRRQPHNFRHRQESCAARPPPESKNTQSSPASS